MAVGPTDDGVAKGGAASDADGPSDETLLARIAERRDKAAFAQIFERYGARIKGYMIKTGADSELAEEAAQFAPARATAPAWIFAIARNKRVDMIRRTARFEPMAEPETVRNGMVETEPASEAAFSELERDAAVRAALADLSEDQREVIRLAFYEGRPHSEIAEALGLPLGTVKSRLRLAFGKLRGALGADFREELLDL